MPQKFFDIKRNKRVRDLKVEAVQEEKTETAKPKVKDKEKYSEFLKTLTSASTSGTKKLRPLKTIKPRGGLRKVFFWLMVLSGLSCLSYFGGAYISRVDITLETKKETQSQEFLVLFKKSPAEISPVGEQVILPLYDFKKSFSYSQDYPATGEGEASSYSRGIITVFNEAAEIPQVLVARTRFESPDGKIFRIQERVVLPGYTSSGPGVLEVEAVADKPGPDYNIGPARFSIPGFAGTAKFEKIYGVPKERFSGGASGPAKIVTAEDIKSAKEKIAEHAFEKARAEITKEIPENLKLLDKAIKLDLDKTTASAVGEVEKTKATITGSLTILVFDENELRKAISNKMAEDQQIKADLTSASYQIFYENPEIDLNNLEMRLTAKVRRDIKAIVDTLEFKQKIAGKSIEDLKKELLKIEGVQKISVSIWPFWVKEAPKNIDAIRIEVK
jgi:hypothetical protein